MADQRSIKYGNQTMPMPDGMTLDQAKAIMARHFPELAENPKVETKKEGEHTTYIFSKQAGRKGNSTKRVVKHLSRLKPKPHIPESVLEYVLADAPDLRAGDEQLLAVEIQRVTAARDALCALAPDLTRHTGVALL